MGKDTVSNEKRAIATRGTKHKPRSAVPDVCHPKADPTKTAPFENWVYTDEHVDPATNTSRSTLIDGMRIWIDDGKVLKPSDPAHPPFDTGVKSKKPYRNDATNITHSRTVYFEKKGAVRTDDYTFQNAKNTGGQVDGSEVEVTAELTEDFYKNACRIKSFEGVCETAALSGNQTIAKAGGALALKANPVAKQTDPTKVATDKVVIGDAKGADGKDYLEIYNGDEIEFTIERWDLTKSPPAKAGECKQTPDHAHWTARQRSGPKKEEKKTATEEFKLSKALTDVGLEAAKESAALTRPPAGQGGGSQVTSVGVTGVGSGAQGGARLARFFLADGRPPLIDVQVDTCGDVRAALIALKPKGKISVNVTLSRESKDTKANDEKIFGIPPFEKLVSQIRLIKALFVVSEDIVRGAQMLLNATGGAVEFKKPVIQFLEGVQLGLACEYKRCEYSGTGAISKKKFSKCHVRPEWKFTVAAAPFFKIALTLSIDLIFFLGTICSGGALSAVSSVLRKLGIDLLVLDITLSVGLNVTFSFGLDQHEKFLGSATSIEGELPIALTVTLRSTIGAGDVVLAELALSVTGSVTGKLTGSPPTKPNTLMRVQWVVEFKSEATLTGKIWVFEKTFGPWPGPSFTPPATESHLAWG